MKALIWLLIPLFAASCAGIRMREEERFLSADTEAESRLFIISFLGKTDTLAHTGMLVTPPNNVAISSSAFVYRPGEIAPNKLQFFFNDSTRPVTSNAFPSVIQHTPSSATGFQYFLYRNKLIFNGINPETTDLTIRFDKQQPFQSKAAIAGIQGIQPIDATTDQQGVLFLHSLSHPEKLFMQERGKQYVWADFMLNGEPHTLYLSSSSAETTTLYTTGEFSSVKALVNNQVPIQLTTENGEIIEFRVSDPEHTAQGKSGFNTTIALLFNGNQIVGTSILYLLSQP